MTVEYWINLAYLTGLAGTMFLSAIAAWVVKQMRGSIDDINDAVNHRHRRGQDAPKLYDAVLHLHERVNVVNDKAEELVEWKRGYEGGPLDNGTKVDEFFAKTNQSLTELHGAVERINKSCPEGGKLPCHWLMNQQNQKEAQGNDSAASRDGT